MRGVFRVVVAVPWLNVYHDTLNKRAQNWNTILVLLAIYNGLEVKQGTQTVTRFILHYFGKTIIKVQ